MSRQKSLLFLIASLILLLSGFSDIIADASSVNFSSTGKVMHKLHENYDNDIQNALFFLINCIGWIKISTALILIALTDGLSFLLSLGEPSTKNLKGLSIKKVVDKINNAGLDKK